MLHRRGRKEKVGTHQTSCCYWEIEAPCSISALPVLLQSQRTEREEVRRVGVNVYGLVDHSFWKGGNGGGIYTLERP